MYDMRAEYREGAEINKFHSINIYILEMEKDMEMKCLNMEENKKCVQTARIE